jgi:hypothetical protein
MTPFERQHRGLLHFLSTIDLSASLDDAIRLAISRFIEMGVLRCRHDEFRLEIFQLNLTDAPRR